MSYCPTCQLPFINEDLLRQAINKWGPNRQRFKASEECCELAVAIHHFQDGRVADKVVITEIADVLIMAHQMRLIFGPRLVDQEIQAKLERLEERLGE